MSLQDKLDAFKADFDAGKPPYSAPSWIPEVMARGTQELIDADAAAKALKVGDKAPAFELEDPEGNKVSSASLLAEGPLVLSFYRGVWCPYCNIELQALQEALPAIEEAGARLVAISPQTPINSRKSVRQNNLTFPILSDPGNRTADKFGIKFKPPDYVIELYRDTFNNDLALVNGDPSWTLPMPARFVIAPDNTIKYAEVNPDYTKRPDPKELLPAVRGAK